MLEKSFQLSSKMRIIVDSRKLESYSQNQAKFYLKYSSFVFRILKRPSFQKFLRWMLKKEEIEEQVVSAVQVKVLPFRRKNGNCVAGKCKTTRGRIQLFPKTIKFCQIFKQKFGRGNLLVYTGNRARAALIHELLHLKYAEDEKMVRELTKKYFYILTQKQYAQSACLLCIYTMIFNTKINCKGNSSNGLKTSRITVNPGETCLRASGFSK